MKKEIKVAWITGILGIVGTVSAAFIGLNVGKSSEQKNIQNEINEVIGGMVNIVGDDNEVTINDIKELIKEYENLQVQNKSLIDQNSTYFNQLMESKNQIEELKSQIDNSPIINYNDLALCIDVDDIPINKNKSMIIIDNREYLSKEIVEKIIPDNKYITIKNNTIFIGQVVAEKDNLFKQNLFDQNGINELDAVTDSYGNNYSNVFCAETSNEFVSLHTNNITYNLDGKYLYLKFSVAIRDNADFNSTGILTIKADDEVIYTSETLSKKTKVFTVLDLPINNCDLLTIEYTPNKHYVDCIISNAIVYNE